MTIAMKEDGLATSPASTLYWYCKHSECNSCGIMEVAETFCEQEAPRWTVHKTVKMKLKLPQTLKFLQILRTWGVY